ncbi:hypothetical protein [Streptomyces sp. NPDC088358]|uniref:hypothetical protein n=1 Tax=Streptomyces sp. NPDC088358 TaxID=3365857 RepID=UPI003829E895
MKKGEPHYLQVGGSGMGGGMGGGMGRDDGAGAAVTARVRKNATAVKESAHSRTASTGPGAATATLCRPDPSDVG